MDNLDFCRSKALNNIPQRKLQTILDAILNGQEDITVKNTRLTAINRYAESNIPIEYWGLNMEKDFHGYLPLLDKYKEYILDLKASYINGTSICFAGSHGVGKTFVSCCILKKACQKGFSCQYCDMSSMISVLTQAPAEEKYIARIELSKIDFLCVDEIDSRFFATSNATNELFIKNLETIIRTRLQNQLPIILCTNSPNLSESFIGTLKASMESIMNNRINTFVVVGEDYRKDNAK
jgi:DNA replication protein DnaC